MRYPDLSKTTRETKNRSSSINHLDYTLRVTREQKKYQFHRNQSIQNSTLFLPFLSRPILMSLLQRIEIERVSLSRNLFDTDDRKRSLWNIFRPASVMAAAININIRLVRLSSTVCPSIFALTHPGCTCCLPSPACRFSSVLITFEPRFVVVLRKERKRKNQRKRWIRFLKFQLFRREKCWFF